MVLRLEKKGCNFMPYDKELQELSDIGNYRVCTGFNRIKTKDGREFFLEFTRMPNKNTVIVDTEFETSTGDCYRDLEIEKKLNEVRRPYTKQSILEIVNEISVDHYESIEWYESFDFVQEKGKNFGPAWEMVEWAKRNHIDYEKRSNY